MFKDARAFSSYSVSDVDAARRFYKDVLGLEVKDGEMGTLELYFPAGQSVFIYPKPDHQPASFTVLNFPVASVDEAVAALKRRGVKFEIYSDGPVRTDASGIARGGPGPTMAWFKDPAGNILSVLEDRTPS